MDNFIVKTIRFYEIIPVPTLQFNGPELHKKTFSMFQLAFPNMDYYKLESDNSEILMDILEYTNEYLFAKCSKPEDIGSSKFLEIRNTVTSETMPLNLGAAEQLETYTFIYIDFTLNKMVVLYNKKISKINELICSFIHAKAHPNANIVICPLKIDNLKEQLKKYNRLSGLQFKFVPNISNSAIIPELEYILDDTTKIKDAKVKISIKECKSVPNFIDNIFAKFPSKSKNLEKLEIIAKNDEGYDEVINFYESIFTKKIPIHIHVDDLKKFTWIRDTLKNELNKI